MNSQARLAHNVYFALKDPTAENKERLVAECYDRLAGIDGILFLAAGTCDTELCREVNDRDFDVSLHVFFRDRPSHDAYQDSQAHLDFIEANHEGWKGVRVFDSTLDARD